MLRAFSRFLAVAVVLSPCAGNVGATIITVPGDAPTIQAGIDAAASSDTVLVAAGDYTENIDFSGKAIKVIGADGAAATALTPADPSAITILMTQGEGAGTEFAGFTVIGGAGGSVIQIEGGAIPVIRNNVFRDYYSTMQNAIVVETHHSNPTVTHNLFLENTGTIGCIGIMSGTAQILWNTFDANMRGFWSISGEGVAKNNIVTNSMEFGIAEEFSQLDYNCVWNNNPNYAIGAVPGANGISADPLYCDPLSEDYSLDIFSPCAGTGEGGSDRGAFGVECGYGPSVRDIAVGDGDNQHVTDHVPVIAWRFFDSDGKPLVSSELEVGSDNDWTVAEMWQPPVIPAPDTSVTYAGLALEDGVTYFIRIRVANDSAWSSWRAETFHMNSVPLPPELELPEDGGIAFTATPLLRAGSLVDGEGDDLFCTFEVYADFDLDTLVATAADVAASGSQASWIVDPPLTNENQPYWWRARASDGLESGPWSAVHSFLLNAVNDPPAPAALLSPEDGTVVFDLTPYYDWEDAEDPDPPGTDQITYTFIIATDSLFLFRLKYPGLPFSYFQSPMVPFGQEYWWQVAATDAGAATSYSVARSLYIPAPADLNGDAIYDVLDVVLMVGVVFRSELIPEDLYIVDANGDCVADVLDVVTLVNHVFRGGPAPTALCGAAAPDRVLRVPVEYQTIQLAINAATDGDTVAVATGTYYENINFQGKAIHVIAEEGPAATLLLPADDGSIVVSITSGESAGTEFSGFTVVGGAGPSVVQIENGAAPLIRNNVFRNYHSMLQNAIVVESHDSDPTIAFNLFLENTGTIGCVGIMSGDGRILNNTFDRNMRGFWSQSPAVIARNNIVTNSNEFGIAEAFDSDYNCVYLNSPDYDVGASPGPHDISADPAYCDPSTHDYRLQPSSPCVGTGDSGATMGAFDVGCSSP